MGYILIFCREETDENTKIQEGNQQIKILRICKNHYWEKMMIEVSVFYFIDYWSKFQERKFLENKKFRNVSAVQLYINDF